MLPEGYEFSRSASIKYDDFSKEHEELMAFNTVEASTHKHWYASPTEIHLTFSDVLNIYIAIDHD